MVLRNKVILVISPQEWGKMLLSKHHYALELAKAGNIVYFLNPPDVTGQLPFNSIVTEQSTLNSNLFMIRHRLYFPYILKFKAISVFHVLMKPHVKRILKKIGKKVDILWSFDLGNLYPFRLFPDNMLKVFHPVDEPLTKQAIIAAHGARIVFSVTHEILDKYKPYNVPREFVNHGVSEDFLASLPQNHYQPAQAVKVGYAGNMLRPDMDRSTLLTIIRDNPKTEFHFFGSYQAKDTNIGGDESESAQVFINNLKDASNVSLHGVLNQQQLAAAYAAMDAFLVCYDIKKDQSKGTNYHKLMEYLATGRVIISNNITTYNDKPELIMMTKERENNDSLPALFKSIINNIADYNSAPSQDTRRRFASANTYSRQLSRISELLEPYLKN